MAKLVNTVLGPIEAGKLGKTLIHEHFLFSYPGFDADCTLGSYDQDKAFNVCVKAAKQVQRYGIQTIVDPTPNECGRDPILLKRISEATGLNIICATGLYFEERSAPTYWKFRASCGMDVEKEFYDMFAAEYTKGIGKTGIKAGFIKLGTGKSKISDWERTVFTAAAWVSRDTGIVILTHTEAGTMGPEQADLLIGEGADPRRIVIGHMCGNTDIRYENEVLKRGVNIGFDRWGYEGPGMPSDKEREAMTAALFAEGYAGRIFFSHDSVSMWRGRTFKNGSPSPDDPEHNIKLFKVIVPELKASGISDKQLEQVFVKNPARLFGLD
jgi:phosphotriesterase-related protein